MIKLERSFTPIKLTPAFVEAKTQEFKAIGTNVWNIDWLKEDLLVLSCYKCAYCECFVNNESNYVEIEHFEDKDHNPDKVLDWDNLLPSCKRCNGSKSNHDVIKDPIVNPFISIPQNEFYFKHYRFKGKHSIGRTTENVININHPIRAVKARFEIGEYLLSSIDKCLVRLEQFKERSITVRRNKLLNCIEAILVECQPNSNYAGTCATILHSDRDYLTLKSELEGLNLWNESLQELHNESEKIVFEEG